MRLRAGVGEMHGRGIEGHRVGGLEGTFRTEMEAELNGKGSGMTQTFERENGSEKSWTAGRETVRPAWRKG